MMRPTDTVFVIHNFNTVPEKLLAYCENYMLYDASTEPDTAGKLERAGIKYTKIQNTGHNLTTYFGYFADNYDSLPDFMCLLKGNIIGRHCSEEFFGRVYANKYFTFLYEDKDVVLKHDVNFLAMENVYMEMNNSWYVGSPDHPHKYFDSFNRLLKFVYENPPLPEFCMFAPGGCYIVSKEQVLKNSREFYVNLNKIMSYGMDPSFPSEAHQVERMLPVIFTANYKVNPWMNDEDMFDERLEAERLVTAENDLKRGRGRIWKLIDRIMNRGNTK